MELSGLAWCRSKVDLDLSVVVFPFFKPAGLLMPIAPENAHWALQKMERWLAIDWQHIRDCGCIGKHFDLRNCCRTRLEIHQVWNLAHHIVACLIGKAMHRQDTFGHR